MLRRPGGLALVIVLKKIVAILVKGVQLVLRDGKLLALRRPRLPGHLEAPGDIRLRALLLDDELRVLGALGRGVRHSLLVVLLGVLLLVLGLLDVHLN